MHAVLTGDIVGSSLMNDTLRIQTFERIRTQLDFIQRGKTLYPVSIYRGDSWQILLDDYSDSLKLTLLIRTALLMGDHDGSNRVDTRISIGIGSVDKIVPKDITHSYGEAFTLSGHKLETMKKQQRIAFSAPSLPHGECIENAVMPLLDEIIGSLTHKQSMALYGALLDLPIKQIAYDIFHNNIGEQSVIRLLNRAHWQAIQNVLDFY